MLYLHFVLDW